MSQSTDIQWRNRHINYYFYEGKKNCSWIHVGMDEMYEIVHQVTYRVFGIGELYKLLMDEMYEIGRFIAKFDCEYSRICSVSVVRA